MKNGHITVLLAIMVIGFLLVSGCTNAGTAAVPPPATIQPVVKETLERTTADPGRSTGSTEPEALITGTKVTGNDVEITVEFTNPGTDTRVMALDLLCTYEFTGKDGSSGASSTTAQATKTVPPNGHMKTSVLMSMPVDAGSTIIAGSIKVSPAGLMHHPE